MMPWPPRQGNEPLDWGDEPIEPPPPPYVGRSIRLALSAAYDYAGSSLAASLLAFVVYYTTLTILFAGLIRLSSSQRTMGVQIIGLVVLVAPLILAPFTAGLYTLAHNMFTRDDPHVFDIWRGAVKLARPACALGYAQTFITTVLVSDVVFLLKQPGTAFKVAAVVIAYILLIWSAFLTYQWPLLVEQGKPLKTILLRSVLLTAHNPVYTLAFTMVGLVLLGLPVYLFFTTKTGPAVLIPVSLVWGILIASLHTSATMEILRRYPEPE